MTRKQIERSAWARKFRKDDSFCYIEVIEYACRSSCTVVVYLTTETGERQFAIDAVVDGRTTGFWMTAYPTKKDAILLCKKMGWEIVSVENVTYDSH